MSSSEKAVASLTNTLKTYSAFKAVFANLLLMAGGSVAVAGGTLGVLTISEQGSYGMMGMLLTLVGAGMAVVASIMLKFEFKYSSFHYGK